MQLRVRFSVLVRRSWLMSSDELLRRDASPEEMSWALIDFDA